MNRCRHRGFQFHEYLNNYYHGLIYWLSSDKWQYEGHLSQLCESNVQPKHFPEWRTMLLDTRRLSCSSWQVWWISVLQSADDCICNILKCVVFPESLYPLILYLISDHTLLYVFTSVVFWHVNMKGVVQTLTHTWWSTYLLWLPLHCNACNAWLSGVHKGEEIRSTLLNGA